MAAATTFSYHVNGPVVPSCNLGAEGAFVPIGECQDGADISITPTVHGIKSDAGGGIDGQPVEYIFLNAIAEIRFRLVPYAGTYVNTLRAMSIASVTDGTVPAPGTLYGGALGAFLPSLYLPNGGGIDVDGPWLFDYCLVVTPGNNRPSTKETAPEWVFRAMLWFNPNDSGTPVVTINGLPLYTRAAPA